MNFNDYAPEQGDFKPFERAQSGQYLSELVSVEVVDRPKWANGVKTEATEPNFLFVYEARIGGKDPITGDQFSHTDSEGKPFQFRQYVRVTRYGVVYQGTTGKMTELLDRLIGRRLTTDEFARLNSDNLVGNKYLLDVELDERGEKSYNVIKAVRIHPKFPVNVSGLLTGSKPAAAPAPKPAAIADPGSSKPATIGAPAFRAEIAERNNITPAQAQADYNAIGFGGGVEDDPFADN